MRQPPQRGQPASPPLGWDRVGEACAPRRAGRSPASCGRRRRGSPARAGRGRL
jgi:hypothetical protein